MTEIERQGRRYYFRGAPFSARGTFKCGGCHWDANERAWWTGKKDVADELLAELMKQESEPPKPETVDKEREVLRGRAQYKGKTYYLLVSGTKDDGRQYAKLCSRDGSMVFWVKDFGQFEIVSTYRSLKSIADLEAYAARRKREAAGGRCECWCHRSDRCTCYGSFCSFHHDGCDSCGCEG